MLELRDGSCYPKEVVGVDLGLACLDGVIAIIAFYQVYVDLISISVLLLGIALACYGVIQKPLFYKLGKLGAAG